ncbi:MAG: copper oxidase [Prosthecobacter sp.]|nr:copper oxidase [Prosthecobacter sp.]
MKPESSSRLSRRSLVAHAAALAGSSLWLGQRASAKDPHAGHAHAKPAAATGAPPGEAVSTGVTEVFAPPGIRYKPVITPNGQTLPWKTVGGAKVFHLIAEPVVHEFIPALEEHTNLVAECWGYNGRVHGPTIEAVEGDLVRIYVTNRLESPTTVHWHGLILPSGMDGVGGVSQKAIQPGETFKYEFTLVQHGTFMYHSHHDEGTQMQLGMIGLFIIHPKEPEPNPPDRDYAILLSEWLIEVGACRPDPNEMTDFNIFTMNGRAFPGTQPLVAQTGERVRIRLGNLSSMSHHAIHMHGHQFKIVATDGGQIPEAGQWPETTAIVPTGSTRTIEVGPVNPGDWVMHCHMLHHIMNQMGHNVGNLIGMDEEGLNQKIRKLVPGYMVMGTTGMADMGEMGMKVPANSLPMIGGIGAHDYITMGGMFTIIKVRDKLPADGSDPGWYERPPGTIAAPATDAELQHDGIDLKAASTRKTAANSNAGRVKLGGPHAH